MRWLQYLSCLFGKHQRSSRSVWHDGDTFHAHCVGCHRHMVRDFDGWRAARADEPEPPRKLR